MYKGSFKERHPESFSFYPQTAPYLQPALPQQQWQQQCYLQQQQCHWQQQQQQFFQQYQWHPQRYAQLQQYPHCHYAQLQPDPRCQQLIQAAPPLVRDYISQQQAPGQVYRVANLTHTPALLQPHANQSSMLMQV